MTEQAPTARIAEILAHAPAPPPLPPRQRDRRSTERVISDKTGAKLLFVHTLSTTAMAA